MKAKLARGFLLLVIVASVGQVQARPDVPQFRVEIAAERFIRTELYFGLTKPDKSTLTEAEWSVFVDEIITPRFPDGFTIIDGRGQWRNREGRIAKENSKVFIVVYPRKDRRAAGEKLDEIREEYKKRFEQESVLRVDTRRSVLVSF